ncbi:hypothetical protein LINPERPRIM_LOCUS8619, partial [Linum perenne]
TSSCSSQYYLLFYIFRSGNHQNGRLGKKPVNKLNCDLLISGALSWLFGGEGNTS